MKTQHRTRLAAAMACAAVLSFLTIALGGPTAPPSEPRNVPTWSAGEAWDTYKERLGPDGWNVDSEVALVNLEGSSTVARGGEVVTGIWSIESGDLHEILAGDSYTAPDGATLRVEINRRTLPVVWGKSYTASKLYQLLTDCGLKLGTLYINADLEPCCDVSGRPGECDHMGRKVDFYVVPPSSVKDLKLGDYAGVMTSLPGPPPKTTTWIDWSVLIIIIILLILLGLIGWLLSLTRADIQKILEELQRRVKDDG